MEHMCADESLNICSEPLNLTDLNDYCQIKLFEYLNWLDLLNIAEASKQLKSSAFDVFKRKYSKGQLLLYSTTSFFKRDDGSGRPILERWDINRSTILKLLRHFGPTFSDIRMGHCADFYSLATDLDAKFLMDLEWYLVEYCLKPDRKAAIQFTEMQFPNIESVFTINCHFANGFSFETNFPSLQSLSLRKAKYNFNRKDWHVPTVKSLYFECSHDSREDEMDLIEMFERHPQLEKLELLLIWDKFSPNIAKCFNESLPKLKSLTLKFVGRIRNGFEPLHFEHITDFGIQLMHTRFQRHLTTIPFTFNRLKCFRILSVNYSATSILDFVFKNRHLKNISVTGIEGNFEQLFQLANVEELTICGFENVASDVVESFLTQCEYVALMALRVH